MYDELIKDLREEAEWAEANEWETPIMLSDHLKQAADAIEKLSKPRWIPVTERLPEDLKFVLAVEDGTVCMAHCEHYYGGEEVYVEWHDTMYYPVSPTHWMPLPQPPEEV